MDEFWETLRNLNIGIEGYMDGDEDWDYYIVLENGDVVGYSGQRPEARHMTEKAYDDFSADLYEANHYCSETLW